MTLKQDNLLIVAYYKSYINVTIILRYCGKLGTIAKTVIIYNYITFKVEDTDINIKAIDLRIHRLVTLIRKHYKFVSI